MLRVCFSYCIAILKKMKGCLVHCKAVRAGVTEQLDVPQCVPIQLPVCGINCCISAKGAQSNV